MMLDVNGDAQYVLIRGVDRGEYCDPFDRFLILFLLGVTFEIGYCCLVLLFKFFLDVVANEFLILIRNLW